MLLGQISDYYCITLNKIYLSCVVINKKINLSKYDLINLMDT